MLRYWTDLDSMVASCDVQILRVGQEAHLIGSCEVSAQGQATGARHLQHPAACQSMHEVELHGHEHSGIQKLVLAKGS